MQKCLRLTRLLTQEFDQVEFTQIPRSQNMGVDELEKHSSSEAELTSIDLKVEVQRRPGVEEVHTFIV